MLFTTGQLRAAFNLTKQQWRGYREALPPLAKDSGRTACFTAADLLATSVVHKVNEALAVPLSSFRPLAPAIFGVCNECPWPQVERSSLLLDFGQKRVELANPEWRAAVTEIGLLVHLAPLVAELRQHLLAGVPDPQRDLAFPPMVASGRP